LRNCWQNNILRDAPCISQSLQALPPQIKYLHRHPGRSGSEVTLWGSFRIICVLWLAQEVALHVVAKFYVQLLSKKYLMAYVLSIRRVLRREQCYQREKFDMTSSLQIVRFYLVLSNSLNRRFVRNLLSNMKGEQPSLYSRT
jgi:hypothetical protein